MTLYMIIVMKITNNGAIKKIDIFEKNNITLLFTSLSLKINLRNRNKNNTIDISKL